MKRRDLLSAAVISGAFPVLALEPSGSWSRETDVAVIGAGGAGLAAALTAAERGLKAEILEKQSQIGGDTLICSGYFNAAFSEFGNSPEQHAKEILESGEGCNSPAVVRAFTENAPSVLRWLQKKGMQFEEDPVLVYGSGHTRSFKPLRSRGAGYIQTLDDSCRRAGVQIRTECRVTEIYQNSEGAVTGVGYVHGGVFQTLRARRAVLIATGGFGASEEKVARFAPDMAGLPSDSAPGATGDGLDLAEMCGAQLVNLSFVESVPGSGSNHTGDARLAHLANRFILVNRSGERFVNELSHRRDIQNAILRQPQRQVFAISDSADVAAFDILVQKRLYQRLHAGLIYRAKTAEKLAQLLNVSPAVLKKSMERDWSGRKKQILLNQPPYWAQPMSLRIHETLGGIAVNERSQVLRKDGSAIPGLFAAGEVVGNLHGKNRLGGNGVSSAVVFGRIAGQNF